MVISSNKNYSDIPTIINKIKSHGIKVDNTKDESYITNLFSFKNYYRFTPYIKLKTSNPNAPIHLTIEHIEERYKFDKKLRYLLLESTESIENFARNDITEYFETQNIHFYRDFLQPKFNSGNLPIKDLPKNNLLSKLHEAFDKSDFAGLAHFKSTLKCTLENIPVWVFLESLEFGTILWIIDEIKNHEEQNKQRNLINLIKNKYNLNITVYISGLKSCKALRNHCAHGCRLYKSQLNSYKPKFPDKINNIDYIKNSKGLYRKLIGLKIFYENRQELWFDFIVQINDHFNLNIKKSIISFNDYDIPLDFNNTILDF